MPSTNQIEYQNFVTFLERYQLSLERVQTRKLASNDIDAVLVLQALSVITRDSLAFLVAQRRWHQLSVVLLGKDNKSSSIQTDFKKRAIHYWTFLADIRGIVVEDYQQFNSIQSFIYCLLLLQFFLILTVCTLLIPATTMALVLKFISGALCIFAYTFCQIHLQAFKNYLSILDRYVEDKEITVFYDGASIENAPEKYESRRVSAKGRVFLVTASTHWLGKMKATISNPFTLFQNITYQMPVTQVPQSHATLSSEVAQDFSRSI